MPPNWKMITPQHAELNLDVIVMHVIARKPDEWIVQTSHGEPKGDYSTLESAQRYAVKFAATMIEKTLAQLAELESLQEVATIGYRARPCVLLVLQLDPSDEFKAEDGTADVAVFEQKRQGLIDDSRTKLRKILADINR